MNDEERKEVEISESTEASVASAPVSWPKTAGEYEGQGVRGVLP